MASNSFGTLFRMTTWGESHGVAIGVVIDGCPAGLSLSEEEITQALGWRRPGRNIYVSPRQESDEAQIYSGLFEGKTTGAPLSILIWNKDGNSRSYVPLRDVFRPGHANFTYLEKYGCFDYRGGGRASARETACRVAAGAVAKKILSLYGIHIIAYVQELGGIVSEVPPLPPERLQDAIRENPLFCPDPIATQQMLQAIVEVQKEGDSLGGIVEVLALFLPAGLGDPVYEKLQANLAKALLSIPAAKGFEMGEGFKAARMRGSEYNDCFVLDSQDQVTMRTNHTGGTLGGISTGQPLVARVAFKPPSSIQKPQDTLTVDKTPTRFNLPRDARHDPCLAIRAVPVVEAMTAVVIVDALFMHQSSILRHTPVLS